MLALKDGGRTTPKPSEITKDVILPCTETKSALGIGNITENFDRKSYLLMDANALFAEKEKKQASLSTISRTMEEHTDCERVVVYIPIFADKDFQQTNIAFFAVAVMSKNGIEV